MAKRAILNLDTRNIEELITKLDELEGDIKTVVSDALEQAAETIEWDTVDAMKASNLPAGGKYSNQDTEKSIVHDARVTWQGTYASIPLGFDFGANGAGGYLITGTPKMKPNYALNKIYKSKRYMKQIEKDIVEIINDAIMDKMGGD